MATLATAATLFLYLGCALAAIRLQRTGEMERSAWLTLLASIGAVYSIWTFAGAGAEATGWGVVLLATGVPIYMLMRRSPRSSPASEVSPAAPLE
jgi:basic amino acid/polyamine antiporter, APA family